MVCLPSESVRASAAGDGGASAAGDGGASAAGDGDAAAATHSMSPTYEKTD